MGDYRVTKGQPKPLSLRERRRRRYRLLGLTGLFLLVLISGGFQVRVPRWVVATGYVTTQEYAEVRPAVVGVVVEILAHTAEEVTAEQVLVRLDASKETAALEEARNQELKITAELSRREAEIDERRKELASAVRIATLKVGDAETKHRRARELVEKGLAAASTLENAEFQEELARADLAALREHNPDIFEKELTVLCREQEAKKDAVRLAEARVKEREVRAPLAGQALRYEFVVGELVRPESVLYELFGGRQVLKLRVRERHAMHLALGQHYKAELGTYSGLNRVWFRGKVESVRNVIQADGADTYRVAYCSFDADGYQVPPGTTVQARVYYGHSCFWYFLLGL